MQLPESDGAAPGSTLDGMGTSFGKNRGMLGLCHQGSSAHQTVRIEEKEPKSNKRETRETAKKGSGAMAMARTMSKAQTKALLRITQAGRAGASAREIKPGNEAVGLALAVSLVRRKLVIATRANRFVLAKFASEIRSDTFTHDDDRHATRIDHIYRTPLPRRPQAKPDVIDTTGIAIKKLPPGEAIGARDLQRRFR